MFGNDYRYFRKAQRSRRHASSDPTMRVTFDTGLLDGTDNLKSAVYFLQRAVG
jgi:hypothetical protein